MAKHEFTYKIDGVGEVILAGDSTEEKTEVIKTNPRRIIHTLNAYWWDIDKIGKEVNANIKKIKDAFLQEVSEDLIPQLERIKNIICETDPDKAHFCSGHITQVINKLQE